MHDLSNVVYVRVEAACDLEILATSKFSGAYFLEEIKGMSDASGVEYKVRCAARKNECLIARML